MVHAQDQTTVQLTREDWARLLKLTELGFEWNHREQDDRILDALRRALK